MFDNGCIAGKLAQAHALLADVTVLICSDTTGPAAYEGLVEAIPASGQLDLVLCLLAERVDRTGEFAADNAVSMASWLRGQANSSGRWASQRTAAGRALADSLPLTRAAFSRGELTLEHVTVIRHAVDGLEADLAASLDRALAGAAASLSPKELRDMAAALLEEYAPDKQDADRERKSASGLKAHLSDTPDGGRLDADLDAEGTAILRAALDKFMPKPEPGCCCPNAGLSRWWKWRGSRWTSVPGMKGRRTSRISSCHCPTSSCAISSESATSPIQAPFPRPACDAWPATRKSSPSSSAPTACPWTSAAPPAPSRQPSGPPSTNATNAAPPPDVTGHHPGPTPTTSGPGSTAEPPH